MHDSKIQTRALVESAFDGVARPDQSLRQFLLTDTKGMSGTITEDEWRLAAITRVDRRWQDISGLEIEHCQCQLAHMQAEAFRYYLPAYMVYALNQDGDAVRDTSVVGAVIFFLTPDREHARYSEHRYRLLDRAQRRAVLAFVRYMTGHADQYVRQAAAGAVAYWEKTR